MTYKSKPKQKTEIMVKIDGRKVKLSDLTDAQLIRLKNQEVIK